VRRADPRPGKGDRNARKNNSGLISFLDKSGPTDVALHPCRPVRGESLPCAQLKQA